ncbi:MAG TPA: hypothetical protein DHU55_00875 [Blastocatellia bacterium]|jgi:hypothetical protein|nr:hypothetical protein [Blastocatellia bacterium]HAF22702.1 hypothetical protein [Blastocatellia bacterium]HCX28317.1 hypothetical protein [Blastocatellia bacterium]
MIPHQRLDNGVIGSGLKDRVTACRKRLRVNRVTHKAQVEAQVEETPTETTAGSGHLAYGVMRNLADRLEYHARAFADTGPSDTETLLLIGEQEVGIT